MKHLFAAFALALSAAPSFAAEDALTITLTDGVVSPQVIEVPAGEAVTLIVVNAGQKPAEFESNRLRIERILPAGTTIEVQLPPLPAGEYPFVEEFHESLETARGTIVAK